MTDKEKLKDYVDNRMLKGHDWRGSLEAKMVYETGLMMLGNGLGVQLAMQCISNIKDAVIVEMVIGYN